jgi:hypothetical protein
MTEPNVTFKPEFIATKYPGYFFNTVDEKLYSMKIDGILKPLKFVTPNYFNNLHRRPIKLLGGSSVMTEGGYYVSVKGLRRFYAIEHLKELEAVPHVIPVKVAL